jgi:hypothetical protein
MNRLGVFALGVVLSAGGSCVYAAPTQAEIDALLQQSRMGLETEQLPPIDDAKNQLQQLQAPSDPVQQVQLDRAEFYRAVRKDPDGAMLEYRKVYESGPATSALAAEARIREADFVPLKDLPAANEAYSAVLAQHPGLRKDLKDHAKFQIAFNKLLMKDEAGAEAGFAELLTQQPNAELKARAEAYVAGIGAFNTTASMVVSHDRATRYMEINVMKDEAFWDAQLILTQSKQPWFQEYLSNQNIPQADRALALYQVAYARWICGYGRDAFETAGRVLTDFTPDDRTKYESVYMRAYLLGRGGDLKPAIDAWRELIDENPAVDFLPLVYDNLADCLLRHGDELGSVFALEELSARFPFSLQAERAQGSLNLRKANNPELARKAEAQRTAIAARWNLKPRTKFAGAQAADKNAGGAE